MNEKLFSDIFSDRMLNITIDPIISNVGPFYITWHGLLMTVGLFIGSQIFFRVGRVNGFSKQSLNELALLAIVLGYIGARAIHVAEHWRHFSASPLSILALNEGGLSILGGIVGGLIAVTIYAQWKRLNVWKLADTLASAAPLSFIVGRIGCTINGDSWGLPTNNQWGLVYWHPNASVPPEILGVPTFPSPTMLQILNLALLVLIIRLHKRDLGGGSLFLYVLLFYSLGRFIINFWQPGESIIIGLKLTQIVATAIVAAILGVLICLQVRQHAATIRRDR